MGIQWVTMQPTVSLYCLTQICPFLCGYKTQRAEVHPDFKGISASITLELMISNKKIYFKNGKLKSQVKHFEVEEILK